MKTFTRARQVIVVCCIGIVAGVASAGQDFFWNNFSSDGNPKIFNTPGNWQPASVPGVDDTVWVTNFWASYSLAWNAPVTNRKGIFDLHGRSITFNLSAMDWTVSESVTIGNSVSGGSTFSVNSGIWNITNSLGTAELRVNWGTVGKGRMWFRGGTLTADHIYSSNTYASAGMDVIDQGTVNTLGDSVFAKDYSTSHYFYVGNISGANARWNILGGTNMLVGQALAIGNSTLYGGSGIGTGTVNVVGSNAYLWCRGNSEGYGLAVNINGPGVGILNVTNGATARINAGLSMSMGSGVGNTIRVTGSNSLLITTGQIYFYNNNSNNTIRVENGGRWRDESASGAQVYISGGMNPDTGIIVDGPGSVYENWGDFYLGGNNVGINTAGRAMLRVQNGGAMTTTRWAALYVGGNQAGKRSLGEMVVTGPGSRFAGVHTLYAGHYSTGTVVVADGGLLHCNNISIGSVGKGAVTNHGGVLQFSTATPTITLAEPGTLIITNGAVSFRNVTTVNVNGNVSGTQLTNATFYGANAFRLNNATNTTTGQTYVFDVTGDSRNYARLEMVDGATRYRGAAGDRLTIGSGGAMLVSNTAAIVDLVFTNNGTLTITKSTLKLNQPATLQGTLRIDLDNLASPSGVLAAGNLTLGPSSTLDFDGTPPEDGATLCTYSGTRSGTFASVTGLPSTYAIRYESASITLVRVRGTAIIVR